MNSPAASSFAVGARVTVPKFGAGDQVTIGFADGSVRIFMAGFVEPA